MKKVLILGITGSIGDSSLKVIEQNKTQFELIGFSYHKNFLLAQKIYNQYKPKYVVSSNPSPEKDELDYWKQNSVIFLNDIDSILDIDYDIVITGIVGSAGVKSTYKIAKQGKKVLLANKESLVMAGQFIIPIAKQYNTTILPIDSEHNSVFRLLQLFTSKASDYQSNIHKIYLTASGGPLRTLSIKEIQNINKVSVLRHPNWQMGAKITVDSAGLINKALEIIEAHYLFNCNYDMLDAIVHPQSYAHAILEHKDGTHFIHTSIPDMVYPINHALFFPDEPKQIHSIKEKSNFPNLFFEPIDHIKFPGFHIGVTAGRKAGVYPTIFNSANEEAVLAFLNDKISFTQIISIIERVLNLRHPFTTVNSIDTLFEVDIWARKQANEIITNLS